VEVTLEAAYEDPQRQIFLTTRDLSETGIYLLAADPPSPGIPARVMLELPGHPAMLRLAGTVARCDEAGFAVALDPEQSSAEVLDALREFTLPG
jgi:hypothetical protein